MIIMWKDIKGTLFWVFTAILLSSSSSTSPYFQNDGHRHQLSSGGFYDNEPVIGVGHLRLGNDEFSDDLFRPKVNSYGELTEYFESSPQIAQPNEEEITGWKSHQEAKPLTGPIYKLIPRQIEKKVPRTVKKPVKIEIEKFRPVRFPIKKYSIHYPLYKQVFVKYRSPKEFVIRTVASKANNW